MVPQLSERFGFLKHCSPEDLKILKKEIKTIVDGCTVDEMPELSGRVTQLLVEFRERRIKDCSPKSIGMPQ